jgi:DNA (cytosine-5)-methyltransferase 1
MDTDAITKFVSELFNISCASRERNTQLSSKSHHESFIDILKKNGFYELNIDTKKIREILKSTNKRINRPDGLYYIEEPFGSQNSPDFILLNIYHNKINELLKFELKTGNKKIMWNDGYPRKDTIYLYTDNKLFKSIACAGDYLINDDTQKVLDKYLRLIKKINTEVKLELSNCSENASGFKIYVRKANSQTIDISKHSEIDLMNFKKNIYIKINKFINIKHTTPSMSKKRGISLFSGAGGDTIGMTNAGVNVVGFVEFDDDAIQTHLLNYPKSELIGKNIYDISDEKFQEYEDIDVIFGGFPCQSFSHCGKKNPNDPRGQLYKEFVRATRIIKPKFILGENVKGILTRKNSDGDLFINDIIKNFDDIGYSMIHKLIRCEKFGVPQKRMRVFFIGINKEFLDEQKLDIDDILTNLPETNNENNTIRSICEFSLVNALKVEKQKFLDIIPDDKVIEANTESEDNGANISGDIATNLLKCYEERSNHGLSFGSRIKSTFSGIEDLDNQTHTILCAYNRMPRLFIPMKNRNGVFLRPFNIKELKQIQGFPVDYQFSGTDSSIIKQIGNAVPPVVVKDIITYLLTL